MFPNTHPNPQPGAAPILGEPYDLQVGEPGAKTTLDVGLRTTLQVVDWNNDFNADLVIGPDGQPGLAYRGGFNAVTYLSPPDPARFARRSPWP